MRILSYVAMANALAARVGLGDLVSCQQGSALALPFTPGSFDAAYLFHVGMHIENKSGLFAEIRRVLAPSGILGIYDVMRRGAGGLSYQRRITSRRRRARDQGWATCHTLLTPSPVLSPGF